MEKYVIKESELRSVIKKIIAEEVSTAVNEGRITHALGSALTNSLKLAGKGILAPSILAQDVLKKTDDISNGTDTITGTVRKFFGADTYNGKSGSGRNIKSGKNQAREKRVTDLEYEERIGKKYGRPKTLPKLLSSKEKLSGKISFRDDVFGNLGRHYEDIDNVWVKLLESKKKDIEANPNLKRRIARQLKGWLDERDRIYEEMAKTF